MKTTVITCDKCKRNIKPLYELTLTAPESLKGTPIDVDLNPIDLCYQCMGLLYAWMRHTPQYSEAL